MPPLVARRKRPLPHRPLSHHRRRLVLPRHRQFCGSGGAARRIDAGIAARTQSHDRQRRHRSRASFEGRSQRSPHREFARRGKSVFRDGQADHDRGRHQFVLGPPDLGRSRRPRRAASLLRGLSGRLEAGAQLPALEQRAEEPLRDLSPRDPQDVHPIAVTTSRPARRTSPRQSM